MCTYAVLVLLWLAGALRTKLLDAAMPLSEVKRFSTGTGYTQSQVAAQCNIFAIPSRTGGYRCFLVSPDTHRGTSATICTTSELNGGTWGALLQDLTRLGQTSVEEPCEPNLDLYAIMKQPPASFVGRWCSIEVGVIAPQSSSSVQIFVRGALPNKTMILDVHLLEESVRDVMVKIQERQGSGAQPLYRSYLRFCSRVMENDRLLSDYHVQKESNLHLSYRMSLHRHGRLTDRDDVHFERLPNEREVSVNVRLPTGKMARGIVHQATTVARLMHALTATDSAAAMRALADARSTMEEACEALRKALDTLVERGAGCVLSL